MRTYLWSTLIAVAIGTAAQAGSVSAVISGGNLYLYGDSGSSNLTVDSPASGQIRVTGMVTTSGENTVVNGQTNSSVTLAGWTRGIFNYGYAGNDTLTLSGLMVNGATHVDLGDGDDTLIFGDTVMRQNSALSLLVIGARGADLVILNSLYVQGATTLDLGEGEDDVFIGNPETEGNSGAVVFNESCVILPGTEADDVNIASASVRRNLIVDDSLGPLLLDISNVTVGDSTFIYGTPSNDRITTDNLNVTNLLKVIAEGGDDVVMLHGSSDRAEVFPGAGNDSVQLMGYLANRAYVYLDPGNDELQIQGGSYSYLYAYGSSGNDLFGIQNASIGQAYLYGESGTDSYLDGGGNSIGKLNLYTIENK